MPVPKNIVDILVDKGQLSETQLEFIRLEASRQNLSELEIIRTHNLVSKEVLLEAQSQALGVPLVRLRGKSIPLDILNFIPQSVAKRFKLIPFEYDRVNKQLKMAMVNPLDLSAIEFAERKSSLAIEPYLALESEIEEAIVNQYAQSLRTEVSEVLKEREKPEKEELAGEKVGKIIKEVPVARIISTIIDYAAKASASDVHIEPMEDRTRVRFRIDGILQEKLALPTEVHDAVISRIKIMANMKIDERRIPQDGRFNYRSENKEVDIRVSSMPVVYGEKIVLRLLPKSGGIPSLAQLGLIGATLRNLESAMLRPHGIIPVCGPTGSGKTTTLYAMLSKINSVKVNIITIEDPVEYEIPGVNQIQIRPKAGLTFASGLRSMLRQDPNIIMVGEIRDEETTNLAIQAALTGHLVFSTLHTNNAAGALPRLLDMGAEPYLLASVMVAVVSQRVVRRICSDCKEEYLPPETIIDEIQKTLGNLLMAVKIEPSFSGLTKPNLAAMKLFRGKGCSSCNYTGYKGRIGIFEVLLVSDKISHLVLQRMTTQDIENQAISEGMVTLKQDGFLKVLQGITTVEEILRVAEV